MTITLAGLVDRLELNVPAYGDVPTAAQYEQAVKDAVDDLSARAPRLRRTTLETVAGQADYTLPDDFLRLVEFDTYGAGEGGAFVTGAGIIPAGSRDYTEEIEIAGLTLTIVPTPTFNADRTLRYAAKYLLDVSDQYPTLSDDLARVALKEAECVALRWIAQAATRDAWSYTVAEEKIDKQKQAAEFAARADRAHSDYLNALAALRPVTGSRSRFGSNDLAYLETI
jgi:hypothetical protein